MRGKKGEEVGAFLGHYCQPLERRWGISIRGQKEELLSPEWLSGNHAIKSVQNGGAIGPDKEKGGIYDCTHIRQTSKKKESKRKLGKHLCWARASLQTGPIRFGVAMGLDP